MIAIFDESKISGEDCPREGGGGPGEGVTLSLAARPQRKRVVALGCHWAHAFIFFLLQPKNCINGQHE